MNTALTPHLFWITSRAAGFAALVLASLAVSLGLLMSAKLLKHTPENEQNAFYRKSEEFFEYVIAKY